MNKKQRQRSAGYRAACHQIKLSRLQLFTILARGEDGAKVAIRKAKREGGSLTPLLNDRLTQCPHY